MKTSAGTAKQTSVLLRNITFTTINEWPILSLSLLCKRLVLTSGGDYTEACIVKTWQINNLTTHCCAVRYTGGWQAGRLHMPLVQGVRCGEVGGEKGSSESKASLLHTSCSCQLLWCCLPRASDIAGHLAPQGPPGNGLDLGQSTARVRRWPRLPLTIAEHLSLLTSTSLQEHCAFNREQSPVSTSQD